MKKMTTKAIGMIVVVAGLMCSCQQQQSSETQGAKYDAYWNTGDSLSDMERLHKWEAYVEEHPQDEMGWRNLHHAKSMSTFYNREQGYQQMMQELMKRVKEAIPDTYTYYLLAKECSFEYKKSKEYAEEALKRLPEKLYEGDYKIWCRYFLREDKDEKRLKDMLTRYYKSGTLSPDVLYFHYNELQGMEKGGIYLGQAEDDLIPKKMIQLVLGMHKDKVLVNRNGDWYKIWRACKVPAPTGNWAAETSPTDDPSVSWHTPTLKILAWIGEHSEHPVYYSASNLREWLREKLSKDLLKNLYNEGLLIRYSPKPYDNIAVTCRNIEERYSLDYLYLPFTPSKDSEKYYSDATSCTSQTIVLLQGILPHYQQYDPQRCHWLSGVLLKAIENRHNKDYSENSLKELRQYYESTKSAAQ